MKSKIIMLSIMIAEIGVLSNSSNAQNNNTQPNSTLTKTLQEINTKNKMN